MMINSLQTLVAISEVTKQVSNKNPDFSPFKPMEYGRLLVISLGTGSGKKEHKYNAKMASKWGLAEWLYNGGNTPLVECFGQASADMVDFHISLAFQALQCEENYLRIDVSIYAFIIIPMLISIHNSKYMIYDETPRMIP